jgi:predicted Kef-type K+ transport protein
VLGSFSVSTIAWTTLTLLLVQVIVGPIAAADKIVLVVALFLISPFHKPAATAVVCQTLGPNNRRSLLLSLSLSRWAEATVVSVMTNFPLCKNRPQDRTVYIVRAIWRFSSCC